MFQTQSGMTDGMIQIQIDWFYGLTLVLTKLLLMNQDKIHNHSVNLILFTMICVKIGVNICKYTTASIKRKY